MNKKYNKLTFIGIETSCDETAVSVVRLKPNNTGKILSNIVSSQVDIHKKFGGVVPELAARAHVQKIERLTKIALAKSKIKWKNIRRKLQLHTSVLLCIPLLHHMYKRYLLFCCF